VNGPGEPKHADIWIPLPGIGEQPTADFKLMVAGYVERRWTTPARPELSNAVEQYSSFA
jgi:hypothetical protein